MTDVVQSNVYLSSVKPLSNFDNEYGKYFDKAFPARATVGIELVLSALLKIPVVSHKDSKHYVIQLEEAQGLWLSIKRLNAW